MVVIVLFTLSIICAVVSLYFSLRAEKLVEQALRLRVEPKPKKILVPNKGIFSLPKKKKKPIYHTDEELWVREQDEKKR